MLTSLGVILALERAYPGAAMHYPVRMAPAPFSRNLDNGFASAAPLIGEAQDTITAGRGRLSRAGSPVTLEVPTRASG